MLPGYAAHPSVKTSSGRSFWAARRTCWSNASANSLSRLKLTVPGPPQSRRHHHRQAHPGNHLAPLHPDLVRLDVKQIELALFDDRFMDLLTMFSGSVSPVSYRAFVQVERLHNRLHRAAIREQRYHNNNQLDRLAQPKEHGSTPFAKRLFTDLAAIATPLFLMNRNGSLPGFASCRTRLILAKLLG